MSTDRSQGSGAHLQCGSRARYVVVFVSQTIRPSWSHEFSWLSSLLIPWRSGGSPRQAGHRTRTLVLLCEQAGLWTLRRCLWFACLRWHKPFPTDRQSAAGLSPVIELKNEFTGDVERDWQGNHWRLGAIGRRGRIVLDHWPDPPWLLLCAESPSLARVAITNAVPQAIDRLPQETRQSLRAIPASSEMGSGSTCEIL